MLCVLVGSHLAVRFLRVLIPPCAVDGQSPNPFLSPVRLYSNVFLIL